jgi:hypothetical protein
MTDVEIRMHIKSWGALCCKWLPTRNLIFQNVGFGRLMEPPIMKSGYAKVFFSKVSQKRRVPEYSCTRSRRADNDNFTLFLIVIHDPHHNLNIHRVVIPPKCLFVVMYSDFHVCEPVNRLTSGGLNDSNLGGSCRIPIYHTGRVLPPFVLGGINQKACKLKTVWTAFATNHNNWCRNLRERPAAVLLSPSTRTLQFSISS